MSEYDNTNRGALFVNGRKETEKHPDYNGSINIEGVDYWLSGWKSFGKKDGKMYLSLSVKKKEPMSKPVPKSSSPFGIDSVNTDEEIPF
jgi:hypothetical protein